MEASSLTGREKQENDEKCSRKKLESFRLFNKYFSPFFLSYLFHESRA
jgi:hypothetical protein